MRREMMVAADALDYERAAQLRDQIKRLEMRALGLDPGRATGPRPAVNGGTSGGATAGGGKPNGGRGRAKGGKKGGAQDARPSSPRPSRIKLIPD
jgi:hypothetical protein